MTESVMAFSQAPIEEALQRLRQKPARMRPFGIIETVIPPRAFVQFAGSAEEGLRFDVPSCNIIAQSIDPDDYASAARLALDTLGALGAHPRAFLRITESDTYIEPN